MINCEQIVNKLKYQLKEEIKQFSRSPYLAIIQVGDNPASNNYIKGKLKDCEEVGIKAELIKFDDSVGTNTIRNKIINLNMNDGVDGIILQLPLPNVLKEYESSLTDLIDSQKDVDGFNQNSPFTPCTPLGVLTLLNELNIDLINKNVTLVGYGKLVNKPLCNLLSDKGANVTICRSRTSRLNLVKFIMDSDIIITATGKRNMIKPYYLPIEKKDLIIIDCGINVENGKQYGDCDIGVYDLINLCTPRIKGMGLFTRLSLLQNTVKAYKMKV